MASYLQGFGLGAGLIIAIGAQNAFVLQQGLKRQWVFVTALVCTICDAALYVLGIGGVGTLIAQNPLLTLIATWGGAAFLLWYGVRSFRSALKPESLDPQANKLRGTTLRQTLLAVLAVSLLNPHVYLDTVIVVGSIGAQYPAGPRTLFALGATTASAVWFFGLAFGAARLAPLFRRPIAWRVLDFSVAGVMWVIAVSLVWNSFTHPLV
jgi:L-lysine exporter family protein LysE/ArgO